MQGNPENWAGLTSVSAAVSSQELNPQLGEPAAAAAAAGECVDGGGGGGDGGAVQTMPLQLMSLSQVRR